MGTETMEGGRLLWSTYVDLRCEVVGLDGRTLEPGGAKVGDRVWTYLDAYPLCRGPVTMTVVAVSECGNVLELELRES
jgi:hypothetical protein